MHGLRPRRERYVYEGVGLPCMVTSGALHCFARMCGARGNAMRGSRAYLPFEAAERSLPVSVSSFIRVDCNIVKVVMALSPLRYLVVAFVLALGAVRASGARYAPAVSSRIVVNQSI
jgi:hypothetical protein